MASVIPVPQSRSGTVLPPARPGPRAVRAINGTLHGGLVTGGERPGTCGAPAGPEAEPCGAV